MSFFSNPKIKKCLKEVAILLLLLSKQEKVKNPEWTLKIKHDSGEEYELKFTRTK